MQPWICANIPREHLGCVWQDGIPYCVVRHIDTEDEDALMDYNFKVVEKGVHVKNPLWRHLAADDAVLQTLTNPRGCGGGGRSVEHTHRQPTLLAAALRLKGENPLTMF